MIGAATPMVAYDGSNPTSAVEAPMIRIVIRKVCLRPMRSPSRPNTSAPNGRTKNPAAKARSAKMYAVVSFTPAKNCLEMIADERAVQIEVVPLEHRAER